MARKVHADSVSHTVAKTPLAPAAIGPYSQGILVGHTLYCSGQIAIDPKTGSMITGSIVDETERVLENLGAVLRAVGMTYENVVRCTVYLVDKPGDTQSTAARRRSSQPSPPSCIACSTIDRASPRGTTLDRSSAVRARVVWAIPSLRRTTSSAWIAAVR